MQLDCYAFDAGNLDMQGEHGSTDSQKFKTEFPDGFGRIAAKTKAIGCRLGMWAGPDGFGDTPEEEQQRSDMMVRLCRDDQFALRGASGSCEGPREATGFGFGALTRGASCSLISYPCQAAT